MCVCCIVTGLTKGSLPVGQRRVKSQIFENLVVQPFTSKQKKRVSAPGCYPSFDPLMEREEGGDDKQGQNHDRQPSRPGPPRPPAPPRIGPSRSDCDVNLNVDRALKGGGADPDMGDKEDTHSPLNENEEWQKVMHLIQFIIFF